MGSLIIFATLFLTLSFGKERFAVSSSASVLNKRKKKKLKTDYMLFIAAGAFHVAKVTDLIPELQGRFPVRVNLKPLTCEDFKAILSKTDNALTRQYEALLAVDHVHLHFEESALDALAQLIREKAGEAV